MLKRIFALLLACITVFTLMAACNNAPANEPMVPPENTPATGTTGTPGMSDTEATPAPATDEPARGGSLKATINSDPVMLDAMLSNTESEQIPAWHIFEGALSCDASGAVWPGVCEYTFENNVLTLTAREGVTFHNGDACTAEDVYASAQRWIETVSAAKELAENLTNMEIVDNSVVLTFSKAIPTVLITVASYDQGLAIIPKSICEKYGSEQIADSDCIGTGPYMFAEHLADRYVLLKRYDAYVPAAANEGATGMAAPKMAYCDEIYFYPVSDKTARITGVQTGEYDIGIGIPSNMIADLSTDPNLVVEMRDLGIFACMIFNNQSGPCTDKNLRNAILACLDMNELMLAAQGSADLYRLNPCYMMTSSQWYVEESLGKYNNVDLEAAKAYLEQSSYDGQPLVFVTTKDNDYFYKTAIVVAQMVKQIGIEMDVQVYDNPTLKQYRNDPTKYDIFSGGLGDKPDPTQVVWMDETWAGFWSNETKNELAEQLANETDFDKRYAIWTEICKLVYEEVPNITFGERINPVVYRNYVHNIFDTKQKYYWNTWISE